MLLRSVPATHRGCACSEDFGHGACCGQNQAKRCVLSAQKKIDAHKLTYSQKINEYEMTSAQKKIDAYKLTDSQKIDEHEMTSAQKKIDAYKLMDSQKIDEHEMTSAQKKIDAYMLMDSQKTREYNLKGAQKTDEYEITGALNPCVQTRKVKNPCVQNSSCFEVQKMTELKSFMTVRENVHVKMLT